jgi:hypothetical protein
VKQVKIKTKSKFMKTEKMSFKNIKDVLSRDEMKGIMAGSGPLSCGFCYPDNIKRPCGNGYGINGSPCVCPTQGQRAGCS